MNCSRLRSTLSSLRPLALICVTAVGLSSCDSKKPSEKQCREFVDHYMELLKQPDVNARKVKKVKPAQKDRLLELCTIEGTDSEVACAMKYSSFDEIAANCK